MVGVPVLARCVCGPSVRTTCPAFSAASLRIISGPSSSATASAVSAAMIARKVMYWKRCSDVKCRAIHSARSSSIGCPLFSVFVVVVAGLQRRDHLLHRR